MTTPTDREWNRIAFITDRDGAPAAVEFARRGVQIYQSAIREAESGGNQYGAAYRSGLLASISVYQSYLEQNNAGSGSAGDPADPDDR